MIPLIALLLAWSPPPAAPSAVATPPRAKMNLAALVRDGDYPESAARANEQGIVTFRLDVGANGRVSACHITGSSGSSALDEATCRIMVQRARFKPARDVSGTATSGTVSSRIGWHISP